MPANIPRTLLAFAAGLAWSVAGLAQEPEPLPATPEELVALLVGENLPRISGNRGIHRSRTTQAAGALIAMGDKAVPALQAALDSKIPIQRLNAAYVLSRIDTPAALVGRLEAAASADNDVKSLAIESLPVYTSADSHRVAWAALSDDAREVQAAAMMAYARRAAKDQPTNSQRYQVAQKIAQLLKVEKLRPTAAWVLGHLDSNVAAQPLVAVLDDARAEVRYEILASLAKIGDKQTTIGILPCLRDPDRGVRCAAARGLAELRDLRATAALTAALADSDAAVRRDAAAALGKIGDWRATARLMPLLKDPDDTVARSVTQALGEIGDRQAVPALIQALQQPQDRADPAAAALGQLGDPRAIAALGQYLEKHADSEVAAQALAKIRHPESVAELARVASTIKSSAARRGLRAIADVGFDFDSPEYVAQWWAENRDHFLRPLPPTP